MHLNDFNIDNESFDIEPELIISEIINNHSNHIFTEKNVENPFGYDLKVYDRLYGFTGYIECEHSHHEKLDGNNWEHSFLKRKILNYDKINRCFTNNLREDSDITIYIKFNNNFGLDDCICCYIPTIIQFRDAVHLKTKDEYRRGLYRTDKNDVRVPKGIDDCIKYLHKYFIIK